MTTVPQNLSTQSPGGGTATAASVVPFAESLRRAFTRPAFVAGFAVLFVAALSLNAATQYMKLYFKKEPVALVKPLGEVPNEVGDWVQTSLDQELSHEMLDVLGTKHYIFRSYVDRRVVGAQALEKLKGKTPRERDELVGRMIEGHPEAFLRVAVTYYTGMVDTVAHIPDRCYVADGFVPSEYKRPFWAVKDRGGAERPLRVRFINFEDQTMHRAKVSQNVAYFFQCNGEYLDDPIDVRIKLQNLLERHGYYAKVELMNAMEDREKAAAVMQDFLSSALPEIERCLPDWNQVKGAAVAGARRGADALND